MQRQGPASGSDGDGGYLLRESHLGALETQRAERQQVDLNCTSELHLHRGAAVTAPPPPMGRQPARPVGVGCLPTWRFASHPLNLNLKSGEAYAGLGLTAPACGLPLPPAAHPVTPPCPCGHPSRHPAPCSRSKSSPAGCRCPRVPALEAPADSLAFPDSEHLVFFLFLFMLAVGLWFRLQSCGVSLL